jgi:hypothetical protein
MLPLCQRGEGVTQYEIYFGGYSCSSICKTWFNYHSISIKEGKWQAKKEIVVTLNGKKQVDSRVTVSFVAPKIFLNLRLQAVFL